MDDIRKDFRRKRACWIMHISVCNHIEGEEKAGCFVIIVLQIIVMWLHTVPWVGLQFVIVVFPDHTHLIFAIFARHLVKFHQLETYSNIWQYFLILIS